MKITRIIILLTLAFILFLSGCDTKTQPSPTYQPSPTASVSTPKPTQNTSTPTAKATATPTPSTTKIPLEQMTPAQVLNLYIDSVRKGDADTFNSLFSKRWLNAYGPYKYFPPQDISEVKIAVYEKD